MIWTEKDLAKFGMMREAGYTLDEIRREFGEPTKNRGGKASSSAKGKKDKTMKEYGKRVQIDPAEFWAMVDAGKTRKDIAKHFDVSVQTVCNRITKGRPSVATPSQDNNPERESKFEEIINGVDAGSKKEITDMDTNRKVIDEFLDTDRAVTEELGENNPPRVPTDAASVYAAMYAEAAGSIMKSAEYAGITVERTCIVTEDGTISAKVEGHDLLGRACTIRLTVDELCK